MSGATFIKLLGRRQRLVGRAEAILEADSRVAQALDRERQQIEAALQDAGVWRRAKLRVRYRDLAARAARAEAAFLANKAVIEALMADAAALDETLTKLARAEGQQKGTT